MQRGAGSAFPHLSELSWEGLSLKQSIGFSCNWNILVQVGAENGLKDSKGQKQNKLGGYYSNVGER